MGAIGDYIHYTAQGYNEYGIMRKTKKKQHSFLADKNTEIGKIKAKAGSPSNDAIQKLEKGLNDFFSNMKTGNSTEVETQIVKEIEDKMKNQFKEKLGSINKATGDITASEEQKERAISQIRKIAAENNKEEILTDIQKRISRINGLLPKLASDLNLDESFDRIEKEYQSINKEFKDLENKIKNSKRMSQKTAEKIVVRENNLIKRINALTSAYAATPAISLQKGEFLEYLVAYIGGFMSGKAVTEISETIDSFKTGGATEEVKIDVENFVQGFTTEEDGTEKIKFDKDVLTIKHSQQKIDVQIDINKERLGASIKNIDLQKKNARIHTVSGSNLMFFLQDIAPDFVNHYLNLNASHPSRKGRSIDKTALEDVNKNMKAVIAAKAITGATYGRTAANVFIVNDNKTGRVRIVSMKRLVDAIANLENTNDISVKLNGKSIYKKQNFINKIPKDDTDRTGAARISILLNSLRSIKLSSSISGGLFLKTYDS